MVCLHTENVKIQLTFVNTVQLPCSTQLEIQTLMATARCIRIYCNDVIKGVKVTGDEGTRPPHQILFYAT